MDGRLQIRGTTAITVRLVKQAGVALVRKSSRRSNKSDTQIRPILRIQLVLVHSKKNKCCTLLSHWLTIIRLVCTREVQSQASKTTMILSLPKTQTWWGQSKTGGLSATASSTPQAPTRSRLMKESRSISCLNKARESTFRLVKSERLSTRLIVCKTTAKYSRRKISVTPTTTSSTYLSSPNSIISLSSTAKTKNLSSSAKLST